MSKNKISLLGSLSILFVVILIFDFLKSHILWVVIIIVLAGIFLFLKRSYNSKAQTKEDFVVDLCNQKIDQPENLFEVESESVSQLLNTSTIGYLKDILFAIRDIQRNCLDEKQHSVYKLNDTKNFESQSNYAILQDITKIAEHLFVDIQNDCQESNILIASFSFFRTNEIDFDELINTKLQLAEMKHDFESVRLDRIYYTTSPEIIGLNFFKNYTFEYVNRLKEIAILTASSDYQITKRENKGLQYYADILNKITDNGTKHQL